VGVPRIWQLYNYNQSANYSYGKESLVVPSSNFIVEAALRERMTAFSDDWNFFTGNHWAYDSEDAGFQQFTYNFCRKFINTLAYHTIGKGFDLTIGPEFADTEKLLNYIWDLNNSVFYLFEACQVMGTFGGTFLAYHVTQDPFTGFIYPQFDVWLPLHTVPEWDDSDKYALKKVTYFWVGKAKNKEGDVVPALFKEERTKERIKRTYQASEEEFSVFDQINPFDSIGVIYVSNYPNASVVEGLSDIVDVKEINKKFNKDVTILDEILEYHGSPITIITGASAGNLEAGQNNIYSIANDKAKVYNLEMDSDLPVHKENIEMNRSAMHSFANYPEKLNGGLDRVSNTSGAAIEMMYQQLIEKADIKKASLTRGIQLLNAEVMNFFLQRGFNLKLPKAKIPYSPDTIYSKLTDISINSTIPKDRLRELQVLITKLNNGLIDTEEALVRLKDYENIPEALKKIEAERKKRLLEERISMGMKSGDMKSATNDPQEIKLDEDKALMSRSI